MLEYYRNLIEENDNNYLNGIYELEIWKDLDYYYKRRIKEIFDEMEREN